jgi:hypothetical protein
VDSLTPVSNIVSDSVLHPGDALNVLYSGFNPNELVLLLIASNPVVIGSANADANGNVVFLTSIPAGTATGSHHLIVYAPVSGFGASQAVTVTIPTPVAGTTGTVAVDNPVVNPDTLPATGRGVIPFLVSRYWSPDSRCYLVEVLRLDGDELFRCGETRRWLVVDSRRARHRFRAFSYVQLQTSQGLKNW